MNRTCGAPIVGLLLCAASGRTAAQTSYEVRGVTMLPAEARISMARSAKPSWAIVPRGGATLRSLLHSVCGAGQGPQVDRELEHLVLRLNGGTTVDRKVDEGAAVAIPFCLKLERRVKVTVEPGDTLEGLLLEHYGLAGKRTLNETFELNNTGRRWANLQEFSRELKPGQEIVLPYATAEAVFTRGTMPLGPVKRRTPDAAPVLLPGGGGAPEMPPPPPPLTLHEIIAATDSPKAALVEGTAKEVPPPPRSDVEFNYVRFVSTTESAQWCPSAAGDASPFDVALLKRRFEVETKTASAFLIAGPNLIGVIDSGIAAVDKPPFGRFLSANPAEARGDPGIDNDRPENDFIDDIYGINFNAAASNGSVLHYPKTVDPDFDHGTKVGTIVLGGPAWLNAWPASQPPWAQLKIVNFSSATKPHPVDAVHLADALRYLLALDVRVVNMSLENRKAIVGVRDAIFNARRTLFVAAAGNEASGGADLEVHQVYPAADGGEAGEVSRRLLTVGAHTLDAARSWAGFSNYSSKRVDLLAPGCNVPTLSPDGTPVRESGTSIATAVASFAAGLLGALGITDGSAIKNRLLVSVDIDPALAKRVRSSGRLNIVKAISLSTDVIEKTDPAQPYEFGRIVDRDELRKFCGDAGERKKLNRMRKVRPNVAGTRIHYQVENNGILAWVDCPQIGADQSIGVVDVDGQTRPGPPLAEVRDIVLADYRR